jgi:hypothetical protein
VARDSAFEKWREHWLRRGEPLAVAAFTAVIGTAASGKDVPLGVALVVLFAGIYTIGAAEAGWWLPGRNTTGEGHERAESLDPR